MAKQIVQPQKKRGPPATGKGTPVQVRLQPDQLAAIDKWIVRQGEPLPSRPEALRRLAEIGLASKPAKTQKAIKVSKLNSTNDV